MAEMFMPTSSAVNLADAEVIDEALHVMVASWTDRVDVVMSVARRETWPTTLTLPPVASVPLPLTNFTPVRSVVFGAAALPVYDSFAAVARLVVALVATT